MAFVHLHNHTHFSLLDGTIRLDVLCERVKAIGQSAVAITDHGVLFGAVQMQQEAQDAGIKPIIGMEGYIATGEDMTQAAKSTGDNYHLTLLAKNATGFANLSRLTSLGHLNGFSYRPRIDYRTLRRHKEGLIVLSGCIGAHIPQTIIERGERAGFLLAQRYQEWFGDDFFIEVMYHGATGGIDHTRVERAGQVYFTESDLNSALVRIADLLGIPIVATNDAHYLLREHGQHHDTFLCLSTGAWKTKPDRMHFPGAEHHAWEFFIKDERDMLAANPAAWWGTACGNTSILADRIESGIVPLGLQTQPRYRIPDDSSFAYWLSLQKETP